MKCLMCSFVADADSMAIHMVRKHPIELQAAFKLALNEYISQNIEVTHHDPQPEEPKDGS